MTSINYRPETGITWIRTSRGEQGPFIDVFVPGRRSMWRRFMVTEAAIFDEGRGCLYGYAVRKTDNVVHGNVRPIVSTLRRVRTVEA